MTMMIVMMILMYDGDSDENMTGTDAEVLFVVLWKIPE